MNDKKRRILVTGIIVFLMLGAFLGAFVAQQRARRNAVARAEAVLLDSAVEQSATLAATLNGRLAVLNSLSAILFADGEADPAAIERHLDAIEQTAGLHFSVLDLFLADGASAVDGHDADISNYAYFQKAMSGEPAMEHIHEQAPERACIVLAVPYRQDGRVAGVLRGLYYEEDLRVLLNAQAYGGDSYSFLVCSRGEIIVNAERAEELVTKHNLFDVLDTAVFRDGDSIQTLRDSLLAGQSATLHYDYNGSARVAVLVPLPSQGLPENNWFVFNVVSEDRLAGEIQTSRRTALASLAVFAACSALALATFLLLENDYRVKAQKDAEITRQREEQFRIVTEQSGKLVMRYDIPNKILIRNDAKDDGFGGAQRYEDAAEGVIRTGWIDPSSEADYRAFFERIDAGETPVTVNILTVEPDGERRWYKHVSTTIFNRDGAPQTAIISYHDDTEQRERVFAYAKWQQELDSLSYDDAALYEWNLTKDISEGARGPLAVSYEDAADDTFNGRTRNFAQTRVFEEDRAAFHAMMNRERLFAMYFSKVYHNSMDYRFIADDGSLRWRRISVQLVPYPDSQDIKAYVINRDVDAEKRDELALIARSQKDFLTGALNRETFIANITDLIRRSPTATHAMLMLDVDGFKQVNDQLGHDAGDKVLNSFVGHIRTVLRAKDIIGRIGGDEFVICLTDMPFDAAIEKKAGQLCAALRRRLSEQLMLSASIGIAVYPRDGASFDELYRRADAALYHAKHCGKDRYAFYRKGLCEGMQNAQRDVETVAAIDAPLRRAVLVATDSDDTFSGLCALLAPEYDALRIDGTVDPATLRGTGNAIYAVIFDTDTRLGSSVLSAAGQRLVDSGLTLYAVTADKSDETYARLVGAGIALPFFKPVDRALLLLRLNKLYAARDMEKTDLQSAYHRLQTSEETRYREVLNATGTTVFVYDVSTGTYQADLLADTATACRFDGHGLGDELLRHGVLDESDVAALTASASAVAAGETPDASHTVKLVTKDGRSRWFRIRIIPMENADTLTPKLLVTVNDVNEQVEADRALRIRAERDALTGLYNRETFYEKAAEMISAQPAGYYVISCFDIDHFKLINDQYGVAKGDEVLRRVAELLRDVVETAGGICCRVMADQFAVLYPASFMHSEEIRQLHTCARTLDNTIQPITFSIGRYIVNDRSLTISAMFDRAALAEASVKGRFDIHIAQYDESMRERIVYEQEIINDMDAALEAGQFELFLQPQYNHSTGALVGAEALVRWRHPKKGLMRPDKFLPIFERNGFIYEMDKAVWKQACALLRRWLDADLKPLPVSVNVSRHDLFRKDFFETITGYLTQYRVPIELLCLEITESAFAESTEHIIGVVQRLADYGFTVEIDDFGSGYSSLNILKDVPAAVLKLDTRFLESRENSPRGGNILESVVRMARWISMSVIAEGVEEKAQADYLQSIGCCYMQGYLYAPPMPVEEFELLAASAIQEEAPRALETMAPLDNDAFWDPSSMETLIFNSYVGGACIFEFRGGKAELLRVNEKYAHELGGEGMSMEDAMRLDLRAHMDERNLSVVHENIRRAIDTRAESTCEVTLFNMPGGPPETCVRTTVRVIARAGDRLLFYSSIANVTAQREAERALVKTSEQLRAIMENVNGGVTATVIGPGKPEFLFANDRYFAQLGYTRAQFEAEVTSAFDLVHPADRERIERQTREASATQAPFTCVYRAIRRDGSIIWLQSNISITTFPDVDGPVQLAVANEIAEKDSREPPLSP